MDSDTRFAVACSGCGKPATHECSEADCKADLCADCAVIESVYGSDNKPVVCRPCYYAHHQRFAVA